MTAVEVYDHKRCLDYRFNFKGEIWESLDKDLYPDYMKSNFYRIKNVRTGHILKPGEWKYRCKHVFRLTNNQGKIKYVYAQKIFDDFNLNTMFELNNKSEFIYGAF